MYSKFKNLINISLIQAEAHPPPKVEWYKETVSPKGTKILEKIHMSAKYVTAIDEFRDFYQLVRTYLINVFLYLSLKNSEFPRKCKNQTFFASTV